MEQKLWNAGITDWGAVTVPLPVKLSGAVLSAMPAVLDQSLAALDKNNPNYFSEQLSSSEQWRIFSHFREQTVYLDIETTGLGEDAEITTIALYDGVTIFHYVSGQNLNDFIQDISRYKVIITYSGTTFDIPVIERHFRMKLPHAHIDLRYVLAGLGFKGGLKSCEKQLGIGRGDLDGIDGYFAVILWQAYIRNQDTAALKTLIAYNIEDTVNLERLMIEAHNRKVATTPFATELTLPHPSPPQIPFTPDLDCIKRLKKYL